MDEPEAEGGANFNLIFKVDEPEISISVRHYNVGSLTYFEWRAPIGVFTQEHVWSLAIETFATITSLVFQM